MEIVIASDAFEYSIGAVMHKYNAGNMKAVIHTSRSLISTKKHYSQIEKALAIIFAVKEFYKCLSGRSFRLQSDHLLLTIFRSKKGIPTYTANRLQCWGTILLSYDFKMEYTIQEIRLYRLFRHNIKIRK